MQITALDIRNFRCFTRFETELYPRMYLSGPNGSGKTSVLEAIAIGAQLRSFRTPNIREAIAQGMEAFSVRINVQDEQQSNALRVGYGATEKRAQINGEEGASRGDLAKIIHIVPITEDAMELVQGFPESRRTLFDQIGCALHPEYRPLLLAYQKCARQRAAVLYRPDVWNEEVYRIMTEQMWSLSTKIRTIRIATMEAVAQDIVKHATMIPGQTISCRYIQPDEEAACSGPEAWCTTFVARERQARRSLMGAHLDDIDIMVDGMTARRYASRGMQKLLVILMKLAHVHLIGKSVVLLDDLMSDFDERRAQAVVELLVADPAQLIFTVPMHERSPYAQLLLEYGSQGIKLS